MDPAAPTRVLLVDDHRAFADSLAALLSLNSALHITGVATQREQAEELVADTDLAIVDIELPGDSGLAVAQRLRELKPELQVLLLSSYVNPDFVFNAVKLGAEGYLLKEEPGQAVVDAIARIRAGHKVYSHTVKRLLTHLFGGGRARPTDALSPKEQQVLREMARGASLSEVAQRVGIQRSTARTIWRRAQNKLGIQTLRVGLVVAHQDEAGSD